MCIGPFRALSGMLNCFRFPRDDKVTLLKTIDYKYSSQYPGLCLPCYVTIPIVISSCSTICIHADRFHRFVVFGESSAGCRCQTHPGWRVGAR